MNVDFGAIVSEPDWACKEVDLDLIKADILHHLGGLDGGGGLNEDQKWTWMA